MNSTTKTVLNQTLFSHKLWELLSKSMKSTVLVNGTDSYTCLHALVGDKSSSGRECLFFTMSPSLGVWEFKNYTTHYYNIKARSWAFKKVNTATECTIAEITTFTKNIYLLKKGPKNCVPTNRFDGKIKYLPINQN